MIKCLCNKIAHFKFSRVSKSPFLACERHFAFTGRKCKLFLDLKIPSVLERTNMLEGIKFFLVIFKIIKS